MRSPYLSLRKQPKAKTQWPLVIIKNVMTSEVEAEMAALYITAKKIIPLRNTLIEMGWPHTKSPIKTENSAH